MTMKERYYAMKSNGLCTRCGEQLDRDKTICSKCSKKIVDRRKERIEKFGICPTCNKKLYGSERQCPECLARDSAYNRKKHDYDADYYKAITQSWVDSHKCVHCGKQMPTTYNRKCCPKCLAKGREYYNRNKKHIPREILYSDDYPYCVRCKTNLRMNGYKVCEECQAEMTEIRHRRTDKQVIKGLFVAERYRGAMRVM